MRIFISIVQVVCYSNFMLCLMWPDPSKEQVVYVNNPIEAGLPGHWVPLSVIKRIIEMRALKGNFTPTPRDHVKYSKSQLQHLKMIKTKKLTTASKHNLAITSKDKIFTTEGSTIKSSTTVTIYAKTTNFAVTENSINDSVTLAKTFDVETEHISTSNIPLTHSTVSANATEFLKLNSDLVTMSLPLTTDAAFHSTTVTTPITETTSLPLTTDAAFHSTTVTTPVTETTSLPLTTDAAFHSTTVTTPITETPVVPSTTTTTTMSTSPSTSSTTLSTTTVTSSTSTTTPGTPEPNETGTGDPFY